MRGCVASTTTTSRPLMAISAAGHQRVPTGPNRPGRPASVAFANAPFTSFSFPLFAPSRLSTSLPPAAYHARLFSPLLSLFPSPCSFSLPSLFLFTSASYLSTLFREDYSRRCNNVFTRRTCRVIPTVLPDRTEAHRECDLMSFCVTREIRFRNAFSSPPPPSPMMISERIVKILLPLARDEMPA